jgi:two-component system, OmpR family, osmolarity sensor histidine kinase EnvZ
MSRQRPQSLFRNMAQTLAVALTAVSLLTAGIIVWQVAYPLGQRAISDLAALMVLSAQTWIELPPETRADFEQELLASHGLRIAGPQDVPAEPGVQRPYLRLLSESLEARTGTTITLHGTLDPEWHWADIPVGPSVIRVGFGHARVGVEPPVAATLLLLVIVLLSLATALVLARRLARPLEDLSAAATRVGSGEMPAALPERGPRELALLARRFNRMATDVRTLLANRTLLLAGISHDLRTPLARMRLAIEMLPAAADPALLAGLRRDTDEMERLVRQFLELGRGLEEDRREDVDLREIVAACVRDAHRGGGEISLHAPEGCRRAVNAFAIRRIVSNLLENAVRYGAGAPVEVVIECDSVSASISVLDRGPGIPDAEREKVFQPFYRLEPSRSTATGGSGLGLAVARQLADANGWELELFARPGGGTEAQLRLDAAGHATSAGITSRAVASGR